MSKILVINSGSATLKFKVFSFDKLTEEISGIVERIGIPGSFLEMQSKKYNIVLKEVFDQGLKNHDEAFAQVAKALKDFLPEIKVVGHRVVHGGSLFSETTKIDAKSLEKLKEINYLAPLHNPVNVSCVESSMKIMPEAEQYAVFDTGYYNTIPDYAYLYSLPEKYCQEYGIRKYGFHGISHKYSAREAAKKIGKKLEKLKIITCHLGSGCSITATKNGQAIETTMGFSPLEGLTMSTRAGDLDASIPLFLMDKAGMSISDVNRLFNKESGLLGICGTMDMREILSASGHKVVGYEVKRKFTNEEKKKCELALKMFVYDIVRYIGQFATVLNGVDIIVFTGGIGERSPAVRSLVLKDLKIFKNFKSLVIPANEELMIAQEISEKFRSTKTNKKAKVKSL